MSIKTEGQHLYLQVIEQLKNQIEDGTYREREKLPSEFSLAKKLGVSRATLREALRILEEENVITRRHGVGTFVNTKPAFSAGIEQLSSVTDMILQGGMTPGTIFISSTTQALTDNDMKRFNCEEDEEILQVERVRTADGQPVIYCIDKVLQKHFKEPFVYSRESLLDALHERAGKFISYAVTKIVPLGYHDKVSPILQCDPETALLVLKQMHYDQNDEPILYSVNYFKADQFDFHVLRKRV
ncbi:GntR family transcriptional regulator [Priestia filamentosa]|uniref:GntR family transcriptional regulator n=1 Tax=Priestia filamentosa TaxID=1402861 RepID=A0A1X7D775_9BACI|nr:GntR family transcriptional regulator [Priestia filamentosa]AKO93785.1 GntR family transcriptional regulator [Priestia filamentosa]MDT3764022.1 GntR family transcriptional regulator [Priestia filamentosa]OXS71503.1 GntR family transcriptional regulator [Priestia filamentosa]RJS67147.1 GntR family transcriptional regulator [Priestia filamentosa]WCM14659.1 GntR family transcriptional regulator [Priestia filamentosa]